MKWYRVPGSQFMHGGEPVGGYYNRYTHRLVLAEEGIEQGPVVRHEMLHALLEEGGHPRSQFLGACASLVVCQGRCIQDAGPWHPTVQAHFVLPPESFDISSHAELLDPEPDGQRWLVLWINVRNPQGRAVVVAAPGDPVTPHSFGFDLRGPAGGLSGGEIATDSSTLFFRPLETKQWLFEFRVASDTGGNHTSPFDWEVRGIPPGDYSVRGDYARRRTAYDTVAVRP